MQENNKKIKVLYMITKGSPFGGAQEYVYTLATSLPKNEFQPVVLTGEGTALSYMLQEKRIMAYTLPTLMRDISVRKEIKSFFALVKIIKKEKPDVLHLNSSKIGLLGALAGRLAGVKRIMYTAHGWSFNEDRSASRKLIITILSWLTIQLADTTIVIAEHEKQQALDLPLINPNKIILIKNGIGKIEFLDKKSAQKELCERTHVTLSPQTVWFGTIAELHKNKGLEYALTALSRFTSHFIYFIIGEGEEREKLEHIIKTYNLQEKVFLLGAIPNAKHYLKAFDAFLLTSIKEGLPYVLLEAGAASLPVIASRIGGVPDIVENNESGILTTPRKFEEITRAIEFVLNNPDEANRFAKNLKQKIEKKFGVKEMLEKTIELYRN